MQTPTLIAPIWNSESCIRGYAERFEGEVSVGADSSCGRPLRGKLCAVLSLDGPGFPKGYRYGI